MAKKKSLSSITEKNMTQADHNLTRMNYTDLKRACIARGMPFEHPAMGSVTQLSSWFNLHYYDPENLELLNEYDKWFEEAMLERGYIKGDAIFHSDLRLGFIANVDENGHVGKKKPRLANKGLKKKEKEKRERIEGTTVLKGTKKALTYQCQKDGLSIKETVEKVMEAYPEKAKESSIKIWYKRAQKAGKK